MGYTGYGLAVCVIHGQIEFFRRDIDECIGKVLQSERWYYNDMTFVTIMDHAKEV